MPLNTIYGWKDLQSREEKPGAFQFLRYILKSPKQGVDSSEQRRLRHRGDEIG